GTVVHISSGVAAFAGALFLGKRKVIVHNKPNIPFVLLGTGLLWFGWFGFNSGSALGANHLATHAMFTTNLASATAMITWVLFEALKGNKPSALGACIGAVIGLVAITPSAGFVDYGSSIFIGFITCVICNFAVHFTTKSEIDDTLDVFPCHGVGGIIGMLLTAVFAKDLGLVAGKFDMLFAHFKGLFVVLAFSFFGSLLIYWITNKITPMRVSLVSEKKGLDVSQHDETMLD
ncbi:MAG: ammonium transporter, partial [Crocinitomicaceae bacterium]|nr:ammonium transporter [Crocinitomicaceae bacterium]